MNIPDYQLAKKATQGNKKAFEQLIKNYYQQIYRTAFLYVHNQEDALDVVQESTYQALISIHTLKNPEYFMTWFTKIIIRCSGQLLEKKKTVIPLADEMISNIPANNSDILISSITAASILGITLGSGFFNSTMNQVLAETPLIGQIYKDFGDSMGYKLAQQDLVTDLEQEQTKNGVTVKLTNAYFDGSVVSITGHVSGDINWGGNEKGEVSFDMNFEHHKGDHDPWLAVSKQIKKKGNGYDFHWTLAYPYEEIKENFTLPLTIHYINGSKGNWNFDIPIKQKKYQTLSIQHSESFPDEDVRININEIINAQASSSLVFETISNYENDGIYLSKAVDNLGNELFNLTNNDTTLSKSTEKSSFHVTNRKMIEKLDPKATSITFYPKVEIMDSPVNQLLNKSSFTLNSERTDLEIQVNKVTNKENQLIVDYEFKGLPKKFSNHDYEILTHNLSYGFTLIDQDYLSQIDPDNPFPPKDHSIQRNKVKVIDKDHYHFQSVFNLDGEETIENFSLNNTVLQYDFNGSISSKELEPFTIELPNK